MKKVPRLRVVASAIFLLYMATVIAAPAQNFRTLASFDGTDGSGPGTSPVQGLDGDFYGTTEYGGNANCTPGGCGTVFKIASNRKLTTLYKFCAQAGCPDGSNPFAGLTLGTDGNFYGTTNYGSTRTSDCTIGCGTVFKITPNGVFTTLHSFDETDGAIPGGGVIQAIDGNFYGTTVTGGANGSGTVFELTQAGTLITLHSFDRTDGYQPEAGLVQGRDGNFYGTTSFGGTNGYCGNIQCGTAFTITGGGIFTTLYNFCAQTNCTDGGNPYTALIQASDGNFYGTAYIGGTQGEGTVFRITGEGALTTLYSFCVQENCTDGKLPWALLQGSDGLLYGTTQSGGANNEGTVFSLSTGGVLTTIYSTCAQTGCIDGQWPLGLVQSTNGSLYGTTLLGGTSGDGAVFSLSVGLGPFLETLPAVGKVGSRVTILGNRMTGTTSVTFNGTAATFTVVSPTESKATVPTGATTGKVQVTTPHGTLTSNVVFHVR